MAEMKDYSGEFKPDFQFSDLSKETLIKLIENYQRIFQGVCVLAVQVAQEEMGKDAGQRQFNEVYRRLMPRFAIPLVRDALNIRDNDVISMFKYFQVAPDGCRGGGMYDFDFEVRNKNDVSYTGNYCQNANFYEKRGGSRRHAASLCQRPRKLREQCLRGDLQSLQPEDEDGVTLAPSQGQQDRTFLPVALLDRREGRPGLKRPGQREDDPNPVRAAHDRDDPSDGSSDPTAVEDVRHQIHGGAIDQVAPGNSGEAAGSGHV